ncbi:hypothetical protein DMH18_26060 [Streptomyces sp. WAC 06783]|uniref:type I-E CRISPR-associated protein Cse2/CasB n=1 Tax=Streptomyces sp. WAC 06783 TaxID=2203211 RepID=UPI000F73A42D|nr:type I-E CRISPR-associated protein Cse2/CasB [Streptomyces sp. WAC 06783]RSO06923.1 hypothetical protein DMH18_26060 [Streptomyces sp. WAC 06783]
MNVLAPQDARPQPGQAHQALAHWLAYRVRTFDQRALGALNPRTSRGQIRKTQAYCEAVRHAETDADRPAFGLTASLFALYHAALPWRDGVRLYGSGDLGQALRRVGTGAFQGPKDPGCQRLFERLVAPGPLHRKEVLLQHAVTRLRTQDRFPPSWAQLAADLSGWAARGEPVQDAWAASFWTPAHRTPTRTNGDA